jgi:uncharacterized protein (DUF2249 family)
MQKYDLNTLIEYDEKRVCPKVLMNEPGYRMVLLSMRAGQHSSEHTTHQWRVTVQAILGHITLYPDALPCELYAGQVACIENGLLYGIEARTDSALLILCTRGPAGSDSKELDLRGVGRPERHPRVLEKLHALPDGGSFTPAEDDDPIPVRTQMKNMRPGQVGREYIKRSPDVFRVRIRRFAPHVG